MDAIQTKYEMIIPTSTLFVIGSTLSLVSGTALVTASPTPLFRWVGLGHLTIAAFGFAAAYWLPLL